jgi:hypothetical protein
MLELVVARARARAREQTVKPPHELSIAQEKNNLSIVLTENVCWLSWWSRG